MDAAAAVTAWRSSKRKDGSTLLGIMFRNMIDEPACLLVSSGRVRHPRSVRSPIQTLNPKPKNPKGLNPRTRKLKLKTLP